LEGEVDWEEALLEGGEVGAGKDSEGDNPADEGVPDLGSKEEAVGEEMGDVYEDGLDRHFEYNIDFCLTMRVLP